MDLTSGTPWKERNPEGPLDHLWEPLMEHFACWIYMHKYMNK